MPGNCDTFIYLGGNEQSTHKYVSELLGKGTIDKRSSGETRGKQGSSSRNYDVLGRELFTADEVRKLDNKKCIIFIRGFDPIMDSKFVPFGHPAFDQTADGKGEPYVHVPNGEKGGQAQPFQMLTPKALSYYEGLKEKGGNVYIDRIDYGDLEILTDAGMKKRFLRMEEQEEKEQLDREQENELMYAQEDETGQEAAEPAWDAAEPKRAAGVKRNARETVSERANKRRRLEGEDSIMNRMAQWKYSKEQKDELHQMISLGMPTRTILSVFYPETDAAKMREIRKTFQTVRHSAD